MTEKKSYPTWPHFEEDECRAVQNVLKSGKVNYWTGDECRQFENEFAQYHGVKHAIALANGTLALELALKVLNIGRGDEVIVPARTFLATASAVIVQGATPICADVDINSQAISVESIGSLINSKTKAIIVVHFAGWSCDMDSIVKLAKEHDLKLIEDCAQAHGARYKDKLVGTFSDIAAFSFCQDKIITTGGEGGMLIMNDSQLWERAWSYKDHGKNFQKMNGNKKSVGFQYVHDQFGSNYRMTEMQAAIGRCQLKKLKQWVEKRRENAYVFAEILSKSPLLRIPMPSSDYYHSYYKFYVFLRQDLLPADYTRDRILNELSVSGLPIYSGGCPEIYCEKAFIDKKLGPKERLKNAKILGETSLMFVVHPTLSSNDISTMANQVLHFLNQFDVVTFET
ncbi:MAG: DegT/DnrJ/EryC1/StrS aminotransferase family protein [Gammaproteobacteria bacterium]|nr:DegT/DnrJ/EryC1/StrS aminotransferase family protein [Gammaproteobacteria bacterium]